MFNTKKMLSFSVCVFLLQNKTLVQKLFIFGEITQDYYIIQLLNCRQNKMLQIFTSNILFLFLHPN